VIQVNLEDAHFTHKNNQRKSCIKKDGDRVFENPGPFVSYLYRFFIQCLFYIYPPAKKAIGGSEKGNNPSINQ